TVGENSRIEMREGMIAWMRAPEADRLDATGPFDPDFPVIVFQRPDGALSAVVFGHSTHTIGTLHPWRRSPSLNGLAGQTFAQETGANTTFIEGASGSTHNISLGTAEAERRILDALRYVVDQASDAPVARIASLKRELDVQIRNFDESKEEQAVG